MRRRPARWDDNYPEYPGGLARPGTNATIRASKDQVVVARRLALFERANLLSLQATGSGTCNTRPMTACGMLGVGSRSLPDDGPCVSVLDSFENCFRRPHESKSGHGENEEYGQVSEQYPHQIV